MDQFVLAACLQPLARLAAGLGRGIDAMGGKGANGDRDRRIQCRDDDPTLCCGGGHGPYCRCGGRPPAVMPPSVTRSCPVM